MTTTQFRPRRMRRQATVMRTANVLMRRVLGLPFRTPLSKNLMLIYLTGRRTGKSYRQPVSYVRYEGALLTPARRRSLRQGRAYQRDQPRIPDRAVAPGLTRAT